MRGENIFNKLSNASEVETLTGKLIQRHGRIIVKQESVSKQIFLVQPISLDVTYPDFTLSVQHVKGPLPKVSDAISVVFHFLIEDKKIIGSGQLRSSGSILNLKFQLPIFSVQRREHFRLRLPSDYKAKISILDLDIRSQFRVTDLSASGLLCEDEKLPTIFTVGQRVEVHLTLPGQDPLKIQCEVRRAPTSKSLKLGLRFVFEDKQSEREMLGLVMDLYRRFFK